MYTAEQSMPDHRLARTRSGYEGYVYQPARPNPPVIFDCAKVAKTWRDYYEPEATQPSEWFDVDWKNVSPADYRKALLAPSRWQVEELEHRVKGGLATASRISAEWKPNVR